MNEASIYATLKLAHDNMHNADVRKVIAGTMLDMWAEYDTRTSEDLGEAAGKVVLG